MFTTRLNSTASSNQPYRQLPLVSFEFDGPKQKRLVATLIAHRGRIHSLEFKSKPAAIAADRWSEIWRGIADRTRKSRQRSIEKSTSEIVRGNMPAVCELGSMLSPARVRESEGSSRLRRAQIHSD